MREPIKDRERIEHMLEMAQNLPVTILPIYSAVKLWG